MCEPRACELEHPRACVDRDDGCAAALRDVVRELALATADIEHALALTNALDEEVVVLRQAVFCVDALVVLDRAEVDPEIRIVVHLQQLSHRALAIRL